MKDKKPAMTACTPSSLQRLPASNHPSVFHLYSDEAENKSSDDVTTGRKWRTNTELTLNVLSEEQHTDASFTRKSSIGRKAILSERDLLMGTAYNQGTARQA